MSKYEKIGKYTIYLDEIYYLSYAGGKRELTEKHEKNWKKTLHLPGLLKTKEQLKLGRENNPNVVPLKGRDLMSFIKELQFIPFFDQYFEHTHILQLSDIVVYESIKQKSYDIALKSK